LIRESGDRKSLATIQNNLAIVLQDEGYLDDAQKLFEESLETSTEISDNSAAARVLGNLGELLIRKGDLLTAKKRFNDQLMLGRKIGDDKEVAYAFQGLGEIQVAQNDIPEARSEYEQALHLREKLHESGLVAETFLAYAELEVDSANHSAARAYAERALDEFRNEAAVDQEALAYALKARALATTDASQASDAESHARSLLPKAQDVVLRLSILLNLGHVKALAGNLVSARADLQSALTEAYKLHDLPHQLAIRSALCETNREDCTIELEQSAKERGFLLIAQKVASTRKTHLEHRLH
jgi:tetratricopeptide (TPR) repeat protein